MPEFFQLYPLSSTIMTMEWSLLLRCGIQSTDLAMVRGSGCTFEYMAHIQRN